MAFTDSEKEKFLASLMDMRRKGQRTEVNLRFQQETARADQVKEANKRLTGQIDDQEGELMHDWLGSATNAMTELGKKSKGIDTVIADIKKKVKIAENVVKAIGFIDDAVAIAKKALAGGI